MNFGTDSRPYRLLHDVGRGLHERLARHPRWAERWFDSLAWLRHAPDGTYKVRLSNSVAAVRWPELSLRPRRVLLGRDTEVWLRPHPGEFDFGALLHRRLGYEPEVFTWLEAELTNYDAVVEIGANVGVFSVFMSARRKRLGRAAPRILAFEPSRLAFERLLDNLRLNRSEVESFNCAVGDRSGVASLYEPAGHLTNGSFEREFAQNFSSDVHESRVIVISERELAALVGESRRTLAKIDVEGAEVKVLRGLQPWITAHRPDIVLEVLPEYARALREHDFLAALGYRFFRIEHAGLVECAPYEISPYHRDHFLKAP